MSVETVQENSGASSSGHAWIVAPRRGRAGAVLGRKRSWRRLPGGRFGAVVALVLATLGVVLSVPYGAWAARHWPGSGEMGGELGAINVRPVPGQYVSAIFTEGGYSMRYYLYTPQHIRKNQKYPVVLVLHGGGERSLAQDSPEKNRDKLLPLNYVNDFTAPDVQDNWPTYILIPQIPDPTRWVNVDAHQATYTLAPRPTWGLALTHDLSQALFGAMPTMDGKRLYLEGISMGAFGVWEFAERWPEDVAAAVPISGGGDPSKARALQSVAVWAFHGSADTTVPVEASRRMVQAARESGGVNIRYTEYPGVEHGVWGSEHVLSTPEVLQWIFAQHR